MGKNNLMRSVGFVIAGAVLAGPSVHQLASKYSNEGIFARQKILIENKFNGHSKLKEQAFSVLRSEIKDLEGASMRKRCEFDTRFSTTLSEGSEKKAMEKLENESFEPYASCTIGSQIKESAKWYSVAGAAAALWGALTMIAAVGSSVIGLARSVIRLGRRKKQPPEKTEPSAENE